MFGLNVRVEGNFGRIFVAAGLVRALYIFFEYFFLFFLLLVQLSLLCLKCMNPFQIRSIFFVYLKQLELNAVDFFHHFSLEIHGGNEILVKKIIGSKNLVFWLSLLVGISFFDLLLSWKSIIRIVHFIFEKL